MTSPTPHQQHRRYGQPNLIRADIRNLSGATRQLNHWAHYVDAPVGQDYRAFAVDRYMAACEAVGAWG